MILLLLAIQSLLSLEITKFLKFPTVSIVLGKLLKGMPVDHWNMKHNLAFIYPSLGMYSNKALLYIPLREKWMDIHFGQRYLSN